MSRLYKHFSVFFRFFSSVHLLLLSAALACTAAQAREMVSVDRAEINLRQGPGTSHDSDWLLSKGFPLEVIGRQGDWLHVSDFEKDSGWVYAPLTGKTAHYVVRVKVANMRSGPGTNNRVIGKAVYGDVLLTLGHQGDWANVRSAGGTTGWIAQNLLWGW